MGYIQLKSKMIEELLDEKGWSYQQLSRETEKFGEKLSVSAISNALNGGWVYRRTAKRIAEALNLTVKDIKNEGIISMSKTKKGDI